MSKRGNGQGSDSAVLDPPAAPGQKPGSKMGVAMSPAFFSDMGASLRCLGMVTDKRVLEGESKSGKPYKMNFVEVGFVGGALEFTVEERDFDAIELNHAYEVTGDLRQESNRLRGRNLKWREVSVV